MTQNAANSYMCAFRQYFNKLVTKGILKVSPFWTFKVVKEAEKTTLTMEGVRALAGYTPKYIQAMITEGVVSHLNQTTL